MEERNEQLEWLRELTSGESIRSIAKTIGVPQRTLHTHASIGALTPEEIVLISRQYGRNPIDSLAQLGFLTWEEVSDSGKQSAAEELPIKQLIEIVVDRLNGIAYDLAYAIFRRPDRIDNLKDAQILLAAIYKDYVGSEPVHPFTYPVDDSGKIVESKCVPQSKITQRKRKSVSDTKPSEEFLASIPTPVPASSNLVEFPTPPQPAPEQLAKMAAKRDPLGEEIYEDT